MANVLRLRVLVLAGGLAILAAGGWRAVRWVRWERHRAVVLCHQVERAAAPGEQIVTTDALTGWVLRRYGDAALRAGLQVSREDAVVQGTGGGGEILLVLRSGSPLARRLSAAGWSVVKSDAELRRSIYFVHRK